MKLSYSDLHRTNILFLLNRASPYFVQFLDVCVLHDFFYTPNSKRNDLPPSMKRCIRRKGEGVRQWQRGQGLGLCSPWEPHSGRVWGLADICALKQKPPEKSLVKLHWSVEKQVRTESKDIASEAGERKCSSLEENGLTTLQHFFSLTCCLQSKFSRGFQDKWARDIWILFSQKLRCLPQ